MTAEHAAVVAVAAVFHEDRCMFGVDRDAKWTRQHAERDQQRAQEFIHRLAGHGFLLHQDVFGEARSCL